MPRRASWAARMVPEAPPPTIATAARRSDLVVRPILRVSGAGFARLDMVIDASDGLARGFGEPAWHDCMDNRRASCPDQLGADLEGANAMTGPAHPKRMRVFNKQAVHRSPARRSAG